MQRILIAFLMASTVLAGCLGGDDTNTPETPDLPDTIAPGSYPADFMNPVIADHDHNAPENFAEHDIANQMVEVAYHPLREGTINTISELDAAGGYVFVAEMGFGFHVYDVSNATDPVLVNSVLVDVPDQESPLGLYMADLKVDASGDWVFVATELSTTPGVLIYDARDKTDITLAGFWPEPGLLLGCHMIEYFVQAEQEYVACAPLDNAVYIGLLLPPVGPTREIVQVARWIPETTTQEQMVIEGLIEAAGSGDPTALALYVSDAGLDMVSGHQDMTYQVDAITHTPLLTVSFWNLGLHWLDVTIPEVPRTLGAWYGVDSEHYAGNLHTAMLSFQGDSRLAVSIPEGAQPPTVFVFNATQFNEPDLTAEWTPKDENGNNSRFSMHNFQVVDGKVYLTMYHGGIWVLDIRGDAMQHDPAVLGTYMPFDRRPDTYGRGLNGGIMSWDLVLVNGYIMTANEGGFYVLALEGDPVGDETVNSFA